MQSNLQELIETEFDAAIMIFCITALADGRIRGEEIIKIEQEVDLLNLGGFDDLAGHKISNWSLFIKNLHFVADSFSFSQMSETLPELTKLVVSRDLREKIISGVFRIAYADAEYHTNEGKLLDALGEAWNM
jgi:hypothetical protein